MTTAATATFDGVVGQVYTFNGGIAQSAAIKDRSTAAPLTPSPYTTLRALRPFWLTRSCIPAVVICLKSLAGPQYTISFSCPSPFILPSLNRTIENTVAGQTYENSGFNADGSNYSLDGDLSLPNATFESPYNAAVFAGSSIGFNINDPSTVIAGDTVAYSLSGSNVPADAYIDPSGAFSWPTTSGQADQTLSFNYVETWTNAAGNIDAVDMQQANISVRNFPNPLTNGEKTVTEGTQVSFTTQAYDPTGGTIS